MQEFLFYIKLGLDHVLDFGAYDHILFLSALAVPFTFRYWKRVVILATIFTIAHCLSLALSVYEVATVNVGLIEFLIPVTIIFTARYNVFLLIKERVNNSFLLQSVATAFFGLIHGFGFSNYFKMLMAEEEQKFGPLIGFAAGIELSQVLIILAILDLGYMVNKSLNINHKYFIAFISILIIAITIPLLIATFPM